jgi:hypothetical protein
MNILVDPAVHSEYGKLIKCDLKTGSVERSIDLDKEGSSQLFEFPLANEIRLFIIPAYEYCV